MEAADWFGATRVVFHQLDKSIIPTIDFGHLHALGQGAIRSQQDYENILDSIFKAVDTERNTVFYVHFSRIEYSAGGEKRHKTYHDIEYGPDFEPLAELLAKRHLAPTIICESQGTMAEDAVILKGIYEQKLSLFN